MGYISFRFIIILYCLANIDIFAKDDDLTEATERRGAVHIILLTYLKYFKTIKETVGRRNDNYELIFYTFASWLHNRFIYKSF